MRRLLLLLLYTGCSQPITEIILRIDQVGINVGRDIDTIHIELGRDKFTPESFYSVGVALCAALPTSGCHDLPLTATLIPGGELPTDNVRAEVQAKLHGDGEDGVVRIRDIANFRFTRGESLHLEIVLTPNCLDDPLRCADVESSCNQFGCYNPSPEPANADMAVVLDLSTPRDLAGVDFKGVDLACSPSCPAGYCGIDKHGCGVACTCDPNSFQTCGSSMMCIACGLDNQNCCPSAPRCQSSAFACSTPDPSGTCVPCIAQGGSCSGGGQPCCAGNVCDSGSCKQCGKAAGDLCCPGATCDSGLTCTNGHCQPCGANSQICCNNSIDQPCQPNFACLPTTGGGADTCHHCGNPSEACCNGACNSPTVYGCDNNGNCSVCGSGQGEPCCMGQCVGQLQCVTNMCQSCGQSPGDACCLNGTCANSLICFQGQCFPPDMAQVGDMAMGDMAMMKPPCGDRGQPCCQPAPSKAPAPNGMPEPHLLPGTCNQAWLDCLGSNPGQCQCGIAGMHCCYDGAPPYCTSTGFVCDESQTVPGMCVLGDMATSVCNSPGTPGTQCCYNMVPGTCAPNYTCCLPPGPCFSSGGTSGGTGGSSTTGGGGSVGPNMCYLP